MPYSGYNLQDIRKDAEIDSEDEFYGTVNKLGNIPNNLYIITC